MPLVFQLHPELQTQDSWGFELFGGVYCPGQINLAVKYTVKP
jgi:hypothetical protein